MSTPRELRSSFKTLTRGIGSSWLHEAQDAKAATKDALVALVCQMRAASMVAQSAHWFVSGPTSKQDHELMGAVYDGLDSMFDSLAERTVGTQELDAKDLTPAAQVKAISAIIAASPVVDATLADGKQAAKRLLSELETVKEMIHGLVEDMNVSDGTRNTLEGNADEIEKWGYMLQQRVK